ncbi:MAG: membrane protein YqaA with SNARE-associated domain [Planctomycetota bacterium]|jgi:membrane protein YqaA with SNARE-associated domain
MADRNAVNSTDKDAGQPTDGKGLWAKITTIPRRMYDWVLAWAPTPYAVPALFFLAFAESSFFPVPPDVLLIAMCIGTVNKSYRFATWCAIGSVVGGMAGYGIGYFLWENDGVRTFFYDYVPGVSPHSVESVRELYSNWDFWIVFAAAFTPIPYKVITILAGVCAINFPMFLIASAVGRSARFFLVAWLFKRYGPGMKEFIEKRFALVTTLGTLVLIGGFVLIKVLLPSHD